MKPNLVFLLFIFSLSAALCQTTNDSTNEEIASGLRRLEELHKSAKDIHPVLEKLQPVAVINGDDLLIFDEDPAAGSYKFIKKVPAPFPMNEGIRASFPLAEYDNKPVCVTGRDAFNTAGGMAVILHEFVHCAQYNSVEQEIKSDLEIYKTAMERKEYSWEINHPFPFDSLFLTDYKLFVDALSAGDRVRAGEYRNKIKGILNNIDFEYLIWQEWKEGFARYIENEIRAKAGAKENTGGKDFPRDRVVFYYGGSRFIKFLISEDPGGKNQSQFVI